MQTLLGDILGWDGKSKDDIQQVFQEHFEETEFCKELVALLVEPRAQVGASWLLKHGLENKTLQVASRQVTGVYQKVDKLEHWEAKLHILQCFSYLPVPKSQAERVVTFLRACLDDENKFVRAWAYNGFGEVARTHTQFSKEAQNVLKNGMEVESAASVKVRIRKALEAGV